VNKEENIRLETTYRASRRHQMINFGKGRRHKLKCYSLEKPF